jgi:hypothetical protein
MFGNFCQIFSRTVKSTKNVPLAWGGGKAELQYLALVVGSLSRPVMSAEILRTAGENQLLWSPRRFSVGLQLANWKGGHC